MSAHRGLSFPLNNQRNQNLFLLFSLKTISPTPYKFCLMLSQSLVSHFSLYCPYLHSHAALKTFLLIDEIRWACCPSGVGGSGVQVQQAPTGHKQLYLRQEAWARSSARGHRVCLHPWSESYPEGTGSPGQKTRKGAREVSHFLLLFLQLKGEMFASFWDGLENLNME